MDVESVLFETRVVERREVVEDGDVVAVAEERRREVAADEPGTARHDDVHRVTLRVGDSGVASVSAGIAT
ncbi:hypothetical protein BN903_110 [Halorubrum sp. AJ67]|nr:hypothetical protein BN903_110 [Halorubrum sp. AJ67]